MKQRIKLILCFTLTTFFSAQAADTPKFSLYGFVLPTWLVSSSAVQSFSQPNLSAFTAAGNPSFAASEDAVRSSFQVAQSRFGFLLHPDEAITARMEFDFIDFSKASPTTAALPRVRRALMEWKASEALKIKFGQDWDIVSPLAPHTFNLVGHYFESGDIGFMRIQLQALYTAGAWEHAFALGLPGNNNVAADATLELGILPTFAWRETYHSSPTTSFGFSALAASLRKSKTGPGSFFAGAGTLFLETKLADHLELRTEAYLGQNTANLGMLGLGFETATSGSIQEAGGYLTLRQKLGESFALFGGVGGSWVLNPSFQPASYVTAGTLAGTGPGIQSNLTARVGSEIQIAPSAVIFGELAYLNTFHHLLPAELTRWSAQRQALVFQLGSQVNF